MLRSADIFEDPNPIWKWVRIIDSSPVMPRLSSRVLPAVRPSHLSHSASLRANPYSCTNRNAPINLSVAENVLSLPEVCEALSTHEPSDLLPSMAMHLSRRHEVSPDELVITPGATACMDALAHVLCERGETILLPMPGYAAIERDISTRSGARVVRYRHAVTDDELLRYVEQAVTQDTKVVVVINPTNPTGEVMDVSTVRAMANWAEKRSLHVVFDEAYAGSVYKGSFCGVHEALNGIMGDFVHVVYTLSKDFGVSGARIGVVHSQNRKVVSAVRGVADIAGVCKYTEKVFGGLLADRAWVKMFLKESCRRLKMAYEIVAGMLTELRVPFVEASAGVFVWTDMTELEGQNQCAWERLFDAGVLVTPGEDCWGGKGWCRICFASVDTDVLLVAMERFRRFVMDIRLSSQC